MENVKHNFMWQLIASSISLVFECDQTKNNEQANHLNTQFKGNCSDFIVDFMYY